MSTALSLTARSIKIKLMEKEKFSRLVGQNIRQQRESRGLSQEELAHRSGLYRTYVGHLENGRYLPSSLILWKLAKALKLPVQKLYPR